MDARANSMPMADVRVSEVETVVGLAGQFGGVTELDHLEKGHMMISHDPEVDMTAGPRSPALTRSIGVLDQCIADLTIQGHRHAVVQTWVMLAPET